MTNWTPNLDPQLPRYLAIAQAIAADLESGRLSPGDRLPTHRELAWQLGAALRQFMARFDLLVTPTLPIPAFETGKLAPKFDDNGKWVNWTPFTYPFNMSQQPAASICCGFTRQGLPVGLQLVGRMFDDHTVLRAAFRL